MKYITGGANILFRLLFIMWIIAMFHVGKTVYSETEILYYDVVVK